MMTDPIADMLTRIRNAQAAEKGTVVLPLSKLKLAIAEILAREGWIARAEVRTVEASQGPKRAAGRGELLITLNYRAPGVPSITSIRRVSKPGRRVYVTRHAIPRVRGNLGMVVISTPHGLLTNKEARKSGVGGEVICEVY
ncbi:MAG: 30S ribosomal protein S8 [Candidatus Uhrbacteria bacterium]